MRLSVGVSQVVAYAVIVAEDSAKEGLGLDLPRWQDVQSYGVWPPYQVSEPIPSTNTTMPIAITWLLPLLGPL